MEKSLTNELKKFYAREGRKIVFTNGMNLSKLADEMAFQLEMETGFEQVDPSVLSKVINGKRLFNHDQLNVFCDVLEVSDEDRWRLKTALHEEMILTPSMREKVNFMRDIIERQLLEELDHSIIRHPIRTPILTIYPSQSIEFEDELRKAEGQEGNRYIMKGSPSVLTLPISVYKERLRPVISKGDEIADMALTLISNRQRRQKAFQQHVKNWSYRDLCPKRSLWRPQKDEWKKFLGIIPETRRQRAMQLEFIVELLQTYPNYEFGLLDREDEKLCKTFWEIKGENVVFLEAWQIYRESGEIQVNLKFIGSPIVDAFHSFFLEIWEKLPRENKDKKYVIAYLKKQIALAQKYISV